MCEVSGTKNIWRMRTLTIDCLMCNGLGTPLETQLARDLSMVETISCNSSHKQLLIERVIRYQEAIANKNHWEK